MLQIFEIVFLVVADLLVLSFFEGVRENWLWYSRVEWLEREKEQKGMKTKEQIAAESLYWDSVVVQMIDKTFFQSLLINVLFERWTTLQVSAEGEFLFFFSCLSLQ